MKRRLVPWLLAACLAAALPVQARHDKGARKGDFSFAVIGHSFRSDSGEAEFRRLQTEAQQGDPAFIISIGIKAASEACSDRLYSERRTLMDSAEQPLVLVPAGSDWADCRNANGSSSAIERLNRIREVFFSEPESLGNRKLALSRQSASPKFRSYAANTYWEHEKVLFATLNVPAKNNHYVSAAGRNSEYEDRMVANRAWLQRLFLLARSQKLAGIVLVTDGDIGAHIDHGFFERLAQKRDGYTDTRRLVRALAEKFPGKVLLVDAQKKDKAATAISWNRNIGHLALGTEWAAVRVIPGSAALFDVTPN